MTTSFDSSSNPIPSADGKSTQLPTRPFQTPTETPQIQPFPPPQTFTFLPQLYTLISRLAPLQTAANAPSTTTTRASRSPTLTRDGPRSKSSASATDPSDPAAASVAMTRTASALSMGLTHTRSREEAIEVKDLPALVYPLRQQIERARDVVRALPDVSRGIAEQEEEIRELEERIGGLRGRMGRLQGLAAGHGNGNAKAETRALEDVVMQGTEG